MTTVNFTGLVRGYFTDQNTFYSTGNNLSSNYAFVFNGPSVSPGDTVMVNGLTDTYEGYYLDGQVQKPVFAYNGVSYILGETGFNQTFTVVSAAYTQCFCAGTMIMTDRGEVAVETLAAGTLVRTASGPLRPVRWLGRRSFGGRFLRANPRLVPIRFRRGSLGDGVPHRDLLLSPEHALLLDGLLVPARCLVNGTTIAPERGVRRVDYFHVELETHDVLLAEGALCESFVDDGEGRGGFDNAAAFEARHPDVAAPVEYYAPRVESGERLAAIQARLAVLATVPAEAGMWHVRPPSFAAVPVA